MAFGHELERLQAGIPGLDVITRGGLPRNRLTLVAGTAGSGKTVFAAQFLASGITAANDRGVFVTFEERPDAILPTMGGQTALNTALSLHRSGVLDKYGVEMIGARAEAIDKAEDRELFRLRKHEVQELRDAEDAALARDQVEDSIV